MFDVGDLPVPTFGNCVLKTGAIKWPLKLCVRFLRFFSKSKKRLLRCFDLLHTFLPARRYASAGASRVSVCLSVSVSLSQVGVLSKQMDESNWFWRGSSFHLSYTVLKGNSSNFRNKGTSFWNFVPESGLWKILPRYIDCGNVIDLARHGGRSERDKRDLRRSAKLTIPPSSDARSIAGDRQALSTARDCRALVSDS